MTQRNQILLGSACLKFSSICAVSVYLIHKTFAWKLSEIKNNKNHKYKWIIVLNKLMGSLVGREKVNIVDLEKTTTFSTTLCTSFCNHFLHLLSSNDHLIHKTLNSSLLSDGFNPVYCQADHKPA